MNEPIPASNDRLLALYLQAPNDAAAGEQLAALFSLHVAPITQHILRTKGPNELEFEEVASAARENLLRQLSFLRSGERIEPIHDFRGYVATVTYSAWAESLRARNPQRALLLNRIRYLLENKTTQKGFALWQDPDGTKWCGFANWIGRTGGATPKRHWLLVDPAAAARDVFGGTDPSTMILPELIVGLFRWLGGPIDLRDLTNAVAEIQGFSKSTYAVPEAIPAQIDPRHSPAEELVWKDYLGWLWQEVKSLSDRQRRAFLFHSDVLQEFELLGIASIRVLAGPLDLTPQELAELWNRLPLDDLTIAKMLDCTRQQVINLRRVARDKLGEAWKIWSRGNNRMASASMKGGQ